MKKPRRGEILVAKGNKDIVTP